MNKLKIPVLILTTLSLLILFALLPKLISSVLDIRLSQTPAYSDIFSFNLSADRRKYTAADKLALLGSAETANATQNQMAMDEGEVNDSVYAFMQQCEAAGIFQMFEPSTVSMQPKLLYDLSDSSKHILVWTVTMLYKGEPSQSLLLDVDDETGQILCVKYNIYQPYVMDGVWERNKTVIDTLTNLYFSELELSEAANSALGNGAFSQVDGGVTEVVYTFDSPAFGRVHMQLTADGAGGFMTTFFK